ncbi:MULTISPECIES: phosphotransferase [Cupriavidus]
MRGMPDPLGGDGLFAVSTPKLEPRQAQALAADVYGIDGSATLLSSERDQNFRIDGRDGGAYVLKVTHPAEDPGVTDFQTQAQLHLMRARPALPVPAIVPTRAGHGIHWREAGGGLRQAVRLITFLPGVPLYKVPRSARQRQALGSALARFDQALAGFSHPHSNHPLLWDIQHVSQLRPLLALVDDGPRRALAARFLDHYEQDTAQRVAGLRRQVIHNDLNAYNVLVDEHDPARVTAILDFGDMVEAPLVNDLAVACAYQLDDAPDPLATALDCVRAYHRIHPLTAAEAGVLPDLIAARLLITVLITGWRARQHPENSAYILRNNALSWTGLHRLAALPRGQAEHILTEAIGGQQENPHD